MSKTGGLYMDELEKAQALNVKLLEALKMVVVQCNGYSGDPWEEHPMQDISKSSHYVQEAIAEAEKEMP